MKKKNVLAHVIGICSKHKKSTNFRQTSETNPKNSFKDTMTFHGNNLKNCGTNPLYSAKNPSDLNVYKEKEHKNNNSYWRELILNLK